MIDVAILLTAAGSWATSALNNASEPVRHSNAAIVESNDPEGGVQGPRSAKPKQEPPTLGPQALKTAAPPPMATVTGPLAPAPPTFSQGRPRESITMAGKTERPKREEHANGQTNATLDGSVAPHPFDKHLVKQRMRESEAKMNSCLNRSVEHGRRAVVKVQFVVEPDGKANLLPYEGIEDSPGVSNCMTAFVKEIKSIQFPRSFTQGVVTVSSRFE